MWGWIFMGTFFLYGAIYIPAARFLNWNKKQAVAPGDEKYDLGLSIAMTLAYFLLFGISIARDHIDYTALAAAGSGPAPYSVPILTRFLSLQELLLVAVTVGFVIFYSSFFLRRDSPFVTGRDWGLAQTVIVNVTIYVAFIAVVLTISFVAIALSQAILRSLLPVFEVMQGSAADVVRREVGPGLSRSIPLMLAFLAFIVGVVLLGIYLVLVWPFKLSVAVLSYLQAKSKGPSTQSQR
jgi:hypothetical protein